MDFWEWLRQVTGRSTAQSNEPYDPVKAGQSMAASIPPPISRRGLAEAVSLVLGRNEVLSPNAPGGAFGNPIVLDPVDVNVPRYGPIEPFAGRYEEPLIRDTLASLAGGPLRISESRLPHLFNASGQASRLTRNITVEPGASDRVVAHEIGHVADSRNVDLILEGIAERNWERQRTENPNLYSSSSLAEFKADLFGRAFEEIQRAQQDIAQDSQLSPQQALDNLLEEVTKKSATGNLLGIDEVILNMLKHPIFAEHPLGRALAERELLHNSTGQNNDQFFLPRIR